MALDEGEAAVYSPSRPLCRIWLDKNGALHIDAESGQDIILNGGTLRVARASDTTDMGSWAHTPASGAGVTPCSLVYTPPGGGSPVTFNSSPTHIGGKIATATGAANVKA